MASIKPGQRVSMPFNVACGFCKNCLAGNTGFCLTVNPGFGGGAYGYVSMGPYRGGQAEYLRVPFADFNCCRYRPERSTGNDFAMLADIFPTGYHGAGGLVVAGTGLAIVLVTGTPAGGLAGFAVMGLGLANAFPLTLLAAEDLHSGPTGPALAAVSTVGYIGFLVGSPAIGLVAERVGLRAALIIVVCLCTVAAMLAGRGPRG